MTGARNGDTAAGYQETRSRCRRGAGRPTRWRTPPLPPFSSHPRHHRPGPTPPTLHSPSTTSPPTRSATSTPLAVQLFSSTPRHPSPSPPTVWLPPPRQSMTHQPLPARHERRCCLRRRSLAVCLVSTSPVQTRRWRLQCYARVCAVRDAAAVGVSVRLLHPLSAATMCGSRPDLPASPVMCQL